MWDVGSICEDIVYWNEVDKESRSHQTNERLWPVMTKRRIKKQNSSVLVGGFQNHQTKKGIKECTLVLKANLNKDQNETNETQPRISPNPIHISKPHVCGYWAYCGVPYSAACPSTSIAIDYP
jgi:hypothetical protein